MAGGTVKTIVLALALCLGGQAAATARIVDPASTRQAITSPAIVAIDSELAALASNGRTTELAARLDQIANDRTIPAVAQEWLLDRGLHLHSTLGPTARSRATVLRLIAREPIVFTLVDPDHGERATPLYDVGATARFVLRIWERHAARDEAAASLLAGGTSAVDRFAARAGAGESDPVRAGIADAFRAASLRLLIGQRSTMVDGLARGRRVDELALILAERLADAELFNLIFGHADAPVALSGIAGIARTLDAQTSFELLALASRRAEIASAAVLAIGRLARSDAAARRFLFDAIDEPDIGPSAAAALAASGDASITPELGRRLAESRTEESRRLLVLALKLDGSAGAREELRRFAATKAGSAQLQEEVQQWLAR